MKHKRELQLLSKALFYGPSTLRGLPSPGEQYCELMPVMADSPTPSQFASRLFYICHVFGGYGLTLVAKSFKSMAVGKDPFFKPVFISRDCMKAHRWTSIKRLLKAYPLLKSLISAFHVALFYFDSSFYSIAHRIAGIRYVMFVLIARRVKLTIYQKRLRRYRQGEQAMDYRLIGVLVLLQILIRICFSTTSEAEAIAGEYALWESWSVSCS
jgi:peroxin-10